MDGDITKVSGTSGNPPKKKRGKWLNMLADEGVTQEMLDAVTRVNSTKVASLEEINDLREMSKGKAVEVIDEPMRDDQTPVLIEQMGTRMETTLRRARQLSTDQASVDQPKEAEEQIIEPIAAPPQIDYSDPVITVRSEEMTYIEGEEPSLDDFISRKEFDGETAYDLHYLLHVMDEDSPKLRSYLEKMAPKPYDATLLWENRKKPFMTPELIHSMMLVGSKISTHTVELNGKPHKERIFIYTTTELGAGKINKVSNVFYATESNHSLLPAVDREINPNVNMEKVGEFDQELEHAMEKRVARMIQKMINSHLDDERIRYIVYPIHISDNAFLMSKVVDKDGNSPTASDKMKLLVESGDRMAALRGLAFTLEGVFKGLQLLDEKKIINTDLKALNIVDREFGGCMIDLGGFYEHDDVVDRPAAKMQLGPYCQLSILVNECLGKVKVGSTHRYQVAKMIERYLRIFLGIKRDAEEYTVNVENTVVPRLRLNKEIFDKPGMEPLRELYLLYIKLYLSYQHPGRFAEKDGKKVYDQYYISDDEVVEILHNLANYPQE